MWFHRTVSNIPRNDFPSAGRLPSLGVEGLSGQNETSLSQAVAPAISTQPLPKAVLTPPCKLPFHIHVPFPNRGARLLPLPRAIWRRSGHGG